MSGLQDIGRVSTYMKTAVTVCVAVIMMSVASCLAGVAINDKHDKTASATLNNVTCNSRVETSRDNKGNTSTRTYYDCSADATYSVNGSTYTKNLSFTSLATPYTNGNSAPVYYDPAIPTDVITSQPISEWMAFAGSSVSCLLAVIAVAWAFLVKNNNVAASIAGVEGVSDLARGIFRR